MSLVATLQLAFALRLEFPVRPPRRAGVPPRPALSGRLLDDFRRRRAEGRDACVAAGAGREPGGLGHSARSRYAGRHAVRALTHNERHMTTGRPSLFEMLGRLRWSVRGLVPPTSPVVMAQAFAYLYGIGATLALISLLLPHDPDRWVPGPRGAGADRILRRGADGGRASSGFPLWLFRLLPGLGALLITSLVYSGGADAATRLRDDLLLGGALRLLLPGAALCASDAARLLRRLRRSRWRRTATRRTPVLNWLLVATTLTVAGLLVALLRQRSERLVALLGEAQDVAHIGSWEWHIPSDEVAWSDELYRIHGLPAGGFPVELRAPAEPRAPRGPGGGRPARSTGRSTITRRSRFEYRIVRPDGVVRILHGGGQVATDDSGRPLRVFGTVQDVTEQRRTQEQFRELVESAPDAMVIANDQGTIQLVNAQAERLFGSARDEIVGRHVDTLVPERFRESHPFRIPGRGRREARWSCGACARTARSSRSRSASARCRRRRACWCRARSATSPNAGAPTCCSAASCRNASRRFPASSLAARFVPGGTGVDVGGDWYDVLELEGGRIGVAIGDVAGRGIHAASLMSQLRNALRAYAFEQHPPAAALAHLNSLAWRREGVVMATVIYLVLDPASGRVVAVERRSPPAAAGETGRDHRVPGGGTLAAAGSLAADQVRRGRVPARARLHPAALHGRPDREAQHADRRRAWTNLPAVVRRARGRRPRGAVRDACSRPFPGPRTTLPCSRCGRFRWPPSAWS